jgi:hypothetical protein
VAGYIYKRTNTTNGKVYIGQCTQKGVDPRWAECICDARKGKGRGARLGAAIRKYGPEVFTSIRIYSAEDLHELNRMETFFIILHQSHLPENGYNLTLGGDSKYSPFKGKPSPNPLGRGKGFHLTPEHRKHLSEAKKGKPCLAKRGKSICTKGKTYEEIMGPEKAARVRAIRSIRFLNRTKEEVQLAVKKSWETRHRNLLLRNEA